jgi:threonine dehydrogenase-like Zn-dependent dehydrogenase
VGGEPFLDGNDQEGAAKCADCFFFCVSVERKSHSACLQGGIWGFGHEGKQAAEVIRAHFADATLVVVPPEVEGDETLLKALLPLTDVMAAGHHAAVRANVDAGARAAVIGDGAVGLCASLAIHRLGVEPTTCWAINLSGWL